MFGRIGAFVTAHWRGEHPPLTAVLVGALMVPLVLLGALAGLEALMSLAVDQLRTVALLGLARRLLVLAVLFWALVGLWRSMARLGRAAALLSGLLLVALAGLTGASRVPGIASAVREEAALAMGRDNMGPPATLEVKDQELLITGTLAMGSADRLQALLARTKGLEWVALDSTGGRILEAQRMAAMIRSAGLDTMVVGECLSACTDLLLAGRERCALEGTSVGFHQGTAEGNDRLDDALLGDEQEAELRALGVAEEFARRAASTPNGDMWLPSEAEMLAAGVLTHSHSKKKKAG